MSSTVRRRVQLSVLVVMLALAVGGLILAVLGRGGWLGVGTALGIAAGALSQLLIVTRSGEPAGLTTPGRALFIGVVSIAATFLVLAGVTEGSSFTWVIVSLFLVGLALTTWGVLWQTRKHSVGSMD